METKTEKPAPRNTYRFYQVLDEQEVLGILAPTTERSEEQRIALIKERLIDIPNPLIRFQDELGKGAFGVVYRGLYKGRPVAIKEVAPHKAKRGLQNLAPADVLQAFEWEVSRLSTLSHANLVHFYGVCQNAEGNLCLVMEYCSNGTLQERFEHARANILGIALPKPKPSQAVLPPIAAAANPPAEASYDILEEPEADKAANPGPSDVVDQVDEVIDEAELRAQPESEHHYDVVEEKDDDHNPDAQEPHPYDIVYENDPLDNPNAQAPQSNQPQSTAPALPLSEIWRIALEIAYGLAYLHQKGTLHRDLKSENILFGAHGEVKLADLGVAQVDELVEAQQANVVAKGMKDFRYAAPEEFLRQSTFACDIYSYGLLLWEMLTGETIPDWHVGWREAGRLEPIPEYCPASLRALIEHCWSNNPQHRPTAQEIILGLEAVAAEYTDQPARACLAQQTRVLLDEHRTALNDYIPSEVEVELELSTDFEHYKKAFENWVFSQTHNLALVVQQFLNSSKPDTTQSMEPYADLGPSTELERYSDLGLYAGPTKEQLAADRWLLSIQTHLHYFSQGSSPVAVIIGTGGLGKSLASYVLAKDLLDTPQPNTPLPIFIRPAIVRWTHRELSNGIHTTLTYYRLTPQAIESLKQTPVLFIIDGYDELSGEHQDNLPQQLSLEQWPNAKLLISLRPDAVAKNKLHKRFAYHDALVGYIFKPFEQSIVQQYLEQFLHPDEIALLAKALDHSSTLRDTLTNPFVLSLFINSWDSQRQHELTQLTQTQIYQTAIQHWIYRQARHLPLTLQQFLIGSESDANQPVTPEALLKAAQYWLSQTAFAMADQQTLNLAPLPTHPWNQLIPWVNRYAQDVIAERDRRLAALPKLEALQARKRVLLTAERYQQLLHTKVQQLLATSPLKDRNGRHQFLHKTLFEYSMAKGIVLALARSNPSDKRHSTRSGGLVHTLGLHPHMILSDAGVLNFLQALTQSQDLADWEAWIEASKRDKAASRSAACAITALNGLQRSLTSRDWRGIRIPEADLRGATLAYTNLTGADLREARLEAADLCYTCLRQATLTGVLFGRPTLKFKHAVICIAINPSGTLLAVGLDHGKIVLQDPETRCVISILNGYRDLVRSVVFSPDSQCLASSSNDTVCLWTVSNGTIQATLKGHTNNVTSIAFSPDGSCLASGSDDNTVRLWTVDRGTVRATLEGHTKEVTSIAFSPDGSCLASGSNDNTVRLWTVSNGAMQATLEGHTDSIFSIAFSPNGSCLASGSRDTTVCLWTVDRGTVRATLKGHTNSIASIAFSPDGLYLASGSNDNTVRLWVVDTGSIRATLMRHTGSVTSIAFFPDGLCLASGSADNTVRLCTVNHAVRATLEGNTKKVTSVAFSPDGSCLASGSADNTVRLWTVDRGTVRATLEGDTKKVTSVAFSPDGSCLASGSADNTVRLWTVDHGTVRATLEGHTKEVTSIAFSPDGSCLASGSVDNTVCLWSVDTNSARATLKGHTDSVTSVAFAPAGHVLASGSSDTTVRLWTVSNGTMRATLEGHTGSITSIAFSPNGVCLASGSGDTTVRLWTVSNGTMRATLKGHTDSITSIAFSPDGVCLASGSSDATVRLWTTTPPPVTTSMSMRDSWGSLRTNACIDILNFAQEVSSVAYATTGQLGIATKNDIQCWVPARYNLVSMVGLSPTYLKKSEFYVMKWGTGLKYAVLDYAGKIIIGQIEEYWLQELNITLSAPFDLEQIKPHFNDILKITSQMGTTLPSASSGVPWPNCPMRRSGLSLLWQTEPSPSLELTVTACDIEGAEGLNQKDINLLEQLGAEGKPVPATTVTLSPNMQGSFHDAVAHSASSTISSGVASESAQALHAPSAVLPATELADVRAEVAELPTDSKPDSGGIPSSSPKTSSLIVSQGFFNQIHPIDHSAPSSPPTTVATTTTQTTTTTTRVTTTVTSNTTSSSLSPASIQRPGIAHLIAQFNALSTEQPKQKPSPAPPSMAKRR